MKGNSRGKLKKLLYISAWQLPVQKDNFSVSECFHSLDSVCLVEWRSALKYFPVLMLQCPWCISVIAKPFVLWISHFRESDIIFHRVYRLKVNFPLFLTKHHAMKTNWGGGIAAHILNIGY